MSPTDNNSGENAASQSLCGIQRYLPNWGEASKMVNHVAPQTPAGMRATRQSVLARQHPPLFPPPSHIFFHDAWLAQPIHFRRYDMADPKKQEKDYTKEVDAIIPEARSLAEVRL